MGFTLKETVEVPRLALKAMRFQHGDTGLQHIHVRRPDPNRVFSLAFKTQAPDKTGVPHILEHTTLCGSAKFPVRDPFFKMQTRSLANFMNAMTGTDYTFYPFATTNKQDFLNLQSVYMDSVFAPLLREQDFSQEGWRLENADPKDQSSPLEFKGVVFNEMKGQMSMPAYQFWTSYFQAIYPSLEYSAGDPAHIPDLTYQQLVQYHRQKYHPDNCVTFSYGDFEPAEALDPLDSYLKAVQPGKDVQAATSTAVPQPVALESSNVKVVKSGPVDPMYDEAKQHKVSLTWYVGSPGDTVHTLAWRVLGSLLTDGHASPFHQAIIDSGLAPEFTVNSGLEETPGKIMFTIGAQGIRADQVDEFKAVVQKTLNETIQSGFKASRVDAIVHQAELGDREISASFGMSVLNRVVDRAFSPEDDVMEVFDNEVMLEKFKSLIAAQPDWFQRQLQLMQASNYFEFVMEPSATYEADLQAAEAALLASRVETLSDAERSAIFERGQALEAAQNAEQDVELLPKVTPADIPASAKDYPVSKLEMPFGSLTVRETPTQGISYISVLREVSDLPQELVPFLQIYTEALTNLGTTSHAMAELEDLIKLQSGGISVGAGTRRMVNQPLGLEVGYGVFGLDTKLERIYELLAEVATSPAWANVSKLKALVDGSAANIMNALSSSGHSYAISQAAAAVSERKAIDQSIGGFSYVQQLKQLSQLDEVALGAELVPKLEQIQNQGWPVRSAITCSPGVLGLHEPLMRGFMDRVGATPQEITPLKGVFGSKQTFVPLPFQVSYVGASIVGPSIETRDSACLTILANLLTNRHLHTEIREKGGAYGGGCGYNAMEGLLNFYSYRDPNPENSLSVIGSAGQFAAKHSWTQSDVDEGKVGVFQGIDSPMSPRSEIAYAFKTGMTLEMRQKRRENLLSVTPEDLNRVAQQYLVPALDDFAMAGVCVVGPENKAFQEWNSVQI